jgi:hypothetical protein
MIWIYLVLPGTLIFTWLFCYYIDYLETKKLSLWYDNAQRLAEYDQNNIRVEVGTQANFDEWDEKFNASIPQEDTQYRVERIHHTPRHTEYKITTHNKFTSKKY